MPNALPYSQNAPYTNAVKHVVGAIADVDLRTSQYLCLVKTTTGTLVPASSAGVAIVGVLQDKPKAGEECLVMDEGDTPVIAGGTILDGAALQVDATGKVVTQTTGVIVGYARGAASVSGAQITMHLAS